jgi:hypothetical protein
MGFEVPAQMEKSLRDVKGKFVLMVANTADDLTSLTQCGFGSSLLNISNSLPEIAVN